KDYKSVLQEFAQRRFHAAPFYQVLRAQGPEHRKTFDLVVKLNGKVYGRGHGHTKKDAEQDAARHTLERFRYHAETALQPAVAPLDEPKRNWWPFRRRKSERLI
ncbi:MAG: putative dsRNA-binding protein, partial [Elusimicrobia bacterium]|nr:putative dsRNA-binding protein [Elusimicrobiota bacterium]